MKRPRVRYIFKFWSSLSARNLSSYSKWHNRHLFIAFRTNAAILYELLASCTVKEAIGFGAENQPGLLRPMTNLVLSHAIFGDCRLWFWHLLGCYGSAFWKALNGPTQERKDMDLKAQSFGSGYISWLDYSPPMGRRLWTAQNGPTQDRKVMNLKAQSFGSGQINWLDSSPPLGRSQVKIS